ncbi:MAG: sulfotransferase domain-containing protein [Pseudomonadales bacterium]|nr:sulfotransferase domain-containing protein [Pseudomonadales bacterium]
MQAPHFLIIGTQKGGTSSLYSALVQHPQILRATRKEVHFFDQHYGRGYPWYLKQFPECSDKQITGEASPFYMAHPLAAQRIAEHSPGIKLIVLLRNPADRAISHYHQEFRRHHDPLSLSDALAAEPERTQADWAALAEGKLLTHSAAQRFSYRRRGHYAQQLQPFFHLFPRTQLAIHSSEQFFQQPLSLLPHIYHFLGVDTAFQPTDLLPRKPGNYGQADQAVRQSLLQYYEPHNEQLFHLLGQRFDWH